MCGEAASLRVDRGVMYHSLQIVMNDEKSSFVNNIVHDDDFQVFFYVFICFYRHR